MINIWCISANEPIYWLYISFFHRFSCLMKTAPQIAISKYVWRQTARIWIFYHKCRQSFQITRSPKINRFIDFLDPPHHFLLNSQNCLEYPLKKAWRALQNKLENTSSGHNLWLVSSVFYYYEFTKNVQNIIQTWHI